MYTQEQVYQRSPAWLQGVLLNAHAWRIQRHRYGRPFRTAVDRLRAQESWSADELRAYQDERVRHVVRLAFDRSRYYREVMKGAGMEPGGIRGVDDLQALPLLTKRTVQERSADLVTEPSPGKGWLKGRTSGTTGSATSFWYDRATCVLNNAVDGRFKRWLGLGERDWIGFFLGAMIVPASRSQGSFWRVNRLQRQVWFSAFHMADNTLDAYVREIERRGLRFLEGFPSTLYILAAHLHRRKRNLPMQAVVTSSETLHDVQREVIENAFQCRLFDFYAAAERVIHAGECEAHEGKHISEDYGFAEIVDHAGNPVAEGDLGYLVGTSLHNVAMPMIRYRTDDVTRIIPGQCACGRRFRRIENVSTKAVDIVVRPDGRMISPSALTRPFRQWTNIAKSQIIQDRLDHIVVRLALSSGLVPGQREGLTAGFKERLGPNVHVTIEVVEDIPREPSGKFRWIISSVQHPSTLSASDPEHDGALGGVEA